MTFWPFFSHFVSGCFFFFFSLFPWLFIVSRKANMLQAQTSLAGWTCLHVPNGCHFLCSLKRNSLASSPLAHCFAPWAAWRGCLWAKWAPGWAGWASRWESGPLSCPLFTVQECHSVFCLPFPWKWKNSSRSCWLLLLVLSLQESASSVLNFTICFLRNCHFKRNLSGFKWLQFLSAYNL